MALGIPSLSPAVNFREIDLQSGGVPNQPGSVGVIAGNFSWGPVGEATLVQNEQGLITAFGAPTTSNTIDFHSAAYFLKYANSLYVIRELDGDSASVSSAGNAYAMTAPTTTAFVKNSADFDNQVTTLDNFSGDSDLDPALVRGHSIIARYPGILGNALEVQICPGDVGDVVFDAWSYASVFDAAPGTSAYAAARNGSYDEVHVVVVDKTGAITGSAGTILEKYPFLSVATDAKTPEGATNYVKDVINNRSRYVHFASFGSSLAFDADVWGTNTAVGTATTPGTPKTFTDGLTVAVYTLANGTNPGALTPSDYIRAFDVTEDPETLSVDLLIAPGMAASGDQATVVNDLVSIASSIRKDAMVIASPNRDSVVGNASSAIIADIVACANGFTASSYLAVDGNYLKVYDRYHDQYIWIPAASSTAGIMAASDREAGPWYSPAGTRRGQYLAIRDIAYNPKKAQRDVLYKASVNPVCTLAGQGTLLYGDKTKLGRPSAFDRINVRRLFLKIEKDLVIYSKSLMFEFNDEFTRAYFVGAVEPYLRSIQGQRGIIDFRVVCDAINNPPEVVDNNEFIASIFVKPARSINNITLNFVATRSGVSFDEVVGSV